MPGEAGTTFFAAKRTGNRHHRHDHQEPADQHREGHGLIVERRVSVEPGEGRAVVAGGRTVGVEDLAKIRAARGSGRSTRQPAALVASAVKPRIDNGRHQEREHGHLDLARLDLLAEIFRSAPDHQSGDEDGDHREEQHAVEARADAADNDLAKLEC